VTSYDYHQPPSLEEAFQLKKTIQGSLYISGGTDVMVHIKNREIHPRALISLRSIPKLSGVENGDVIRIGAMTTITDLIRDPVLCEHYPILIQAARKLGSVQIRNVATVGGNLCNCSPAADLAPPLLVLGAKVRLQGGRKSRDVPIDKFFRGPGESCLASDEILTDVLIGSPEQNPKTLFLKKGRVKMDLAIASVAVLLETEGDRCLTARIAAGSVAPVPLRLSQVESLLEGARLSPKLLSDVQQLSSKSVSPITDVRSTKEYRRHIVGALIKRALEKLMGWSEA